MTSNNAQLNLVLSGGGIKGLAFIGAYEELATRYSKFGNIAGVSAGALVGALIGAGYTPKELMKIIFDFDFSEIMVTDSILNKQVESQIRKALDDRSTSGGNPLEALLYRKDLTGLQTDRDYNDFTGTRGTFLSNLISYSKKNAFLNGDILEQWVKGLLAYKGISTFGDLKTGIADKVNPRGYKVRMTAVDANLGKVIVLPDDIVSYNMDPDKLEIAKAVRMSCCIPFVFTPVVINKQQNNHIKKHYIIDGGVLDNFPVWLIDSSQSNPIIGLKLEGKEPKSLIGAENLLKKLISTSQDTGVPKNAYNIDNIAHIDTGEISFLDFNIDDEQKQYLYNQGKIAVKKLYAGMRSTGRRAYGLNRRFLR